jgi:hypothetical protein
MASLGHFVPSDDPSMMLANVLHNLVVFFRNDQRVRIHYNGRVYINRNGSLRIYWNDGAEITFHLVVSPFSELEPYCEYDGSSLCVFGDFNFCMEDGGYSIRDNTLHLCFDNDEDLLHNMTSIARQCVSALL